MQCHYFTDYRRENISPSLAGCGHYDATPTACYSAMVQLGMYVRMSTECIHIELFVWY